MEYIVQKIGMSRTITVPSVPVTLLKLIETKVCEVTDGTAIVAYGSGKKTNKAVAGKQKKYSIDAQFNRFATMQVTNTEAGDIDLSALIEAKVIKTSMTTKGHGFTGVMKRWNFGGGPGSHGHRMHRTGGSIGNCEWPGRVQKGRKMAGQHGNVKVTVKNEVLSFDAENGVLAVKGSVAGANGGLGRVKVVK